MSDISSNPESATEPIRPGDIPQMKRIRFWRRVMWVSVVGITAPVVFEVYRGVCMVSKVLGGFEIFWERPDVAWVLATEMYGSGRFILEGLVLSGVCLLLFILSLVFQRLARLELEDQLIHGHKKAGAVRLQLL